MQIQTLPKWVLATAVFGSVFLLGWLDWLTGHELNFFVFYFLPVSLGAWFLGLGPAIALAVLSAVVWFTANDLVGPTSSTPFFAVWNTSIRLVSFLTIGYAVSRMQAALAEEHATSEMLRKALSEIKVLESFLPICAQCKKIRDTQGAWQPLETYISQHSNTHFSHGFCPECAKRAIAQAGLGGDPTSTA